MKCAGGVWQIVEILQNSNESRLRLRPADAYSNNIVRLSKKQNNGYNKKHT